MVLMPLLSVVVPTLDRPDTLRHALATMACQPADADCEFVVQNNGGNPDIAAMVEGLKDARFKHFASDTVLTMTDNWEAALGHASGEYVTFIGDDDGLMPYACATATDILAGRKIDLLSWRAYSYYWPDYYHPAFRNRLLAEIDLASSVKRVSSRSELARIFAFQAHYSYLPMIYNSFVRRSVIDRMRAIGGRYFIGLSPDVASGIANAALTDSFVRLSRPLGMSGISSHSTGHALFFETTDLLATSRGARDFGAIDAELQLPDLNALELFIAKDMLVLKRLLLADDNHVQLGYRALAQALATGINDRPLLYDRTVQTIGELARTHGFDVADIIVPAHLADRPSPGRRGVRAAGPNRATYELDGSALGLSSIADAVRVIAQFVPDQEPFDPANLEVSASVPLLGTEELDFAREGTGVAALIEGWSETEEWGTWSVARSCTLRFEVRPVPSRPLELVLACRAFVSEKNPQLRVVCRVGNGALQQLDFSMDAFAGLRRLMLDPVAIATDGTLTISLALSDPRSPADLALSSDVRPLGIGLERVWLDRGVRTPQHR
ncbi:glycosyltransferase [Bradyrhizobium sp. OK095]|uniref:glycosyltransferase family 2 protein n=1 Tax=Bradyrhizobium sp. OK095 TaxID=1882760 RepID=UPI0008CD5367|nr:glycosyltransferase [Bradyrhizobium sp. OK095]SEN78863.1 Glycosyltransferase involved in cell wall bisynthesis [Bradyrhizobium sp. OK095]